ncbi:homoserine kinase [Aquimarina sp. W85]|uniref:homoserine kinase n=1 Tax=Aquimarina rhodophyticola TaxID=3342246 RepID=UPI00366E6DD3
MKKIKIFSPSTIANLSCGFDVLGCCLDTIGDEMTVSIENGNGVEIDKIEGANLPREAHLNVASVAVQALLVELKEPKKVIISIHKKIKAGSGIGSSAASSAGAVWAVNELLGQPFTPNDLIRFAMHGENIASGSPHADNVAPALLGGVTLIRSYTPLDVIKLPFPEDLTAVIIHPQIEIKTSDARAVLKQHILLKDAVVQWGNIGGLVAGLCLSDYGLISRSLEDVIIEPLRSVLIPNFDIIKKTALEHGALGCGISGSGPAIFALSKGIKNANKIASAMHALRLSTEITFDIYISTINATGIRIIA